MRKETDMLKNWYRRHGGTPALLCGVFAGLGIACLITMALAGAP